MTYKLWEESLLKYLKNLSKEDKDEILSYYREMYSDKRDTGISESEIVASFGDPMLAAARILKESGEEAEGRSREDHIEKPADKRNSHGEDHFEESTAPVSNKAAREDGKNASGISASRIIGWIFITLLFTIPLFAVVLSVIASLAATTISGGAMLIGGIIGAVASPFLLFFGNTLSTVLLIFGGMLITAGVGALLLIVFYYITKYSVVSTYKIARHFVRRKK